MESNHIFFNSNFTMPDFDPLTPQDHLFDFFAPNLPGMILDNEVSMRDHPWEIPHLHPEESHSVLTLQNHPVFTTNPIKLHQNEYDNDNASNLGFSAEEWKELFESWEKEPILPAKPHVADSYLFDGPIMETRVNVPDQLYTGFGNTVQTQPLIDDDVGDFYCLARQIQDGMRESVKTTLPTKLTEHSPEFHQVKVATTQKRKRSLWSAEEHRLFLKGLEVFKKGDWKSISRHFVPTRSHIQIASHAQKYFIRLNESNVTRKRRKSIHDKDYK